MADFPTPCPKCGGRMYDDTQSKFWNGGLTSNGKKKPVATCQRKKEGCDGVIWPPREEPASKSLYKAPPKVTRPAGWPHGPEDEPWESRAAEQQQANAASHAPPATITTVSADRKMTTLDLHRVCFEHAIKLAGMAEVAGITVDFAGVSALTAQTFIALTK